MFTAKRPWHIAGADESLEIGSPMIPSDKLQEVQLPLTRPALPELLYGFRGRSQPKSRELKMIPTWEVFMSFGNCETVFQLWLDQIGLQAVEMGNAKLYHTGASQLLHRILHLWFAGSELLCSHQMCSKVQVQTVACSKGFVKGLLDDSLSIEFGGKHLTSVFQREQT